MAQVVRLWSTDEPACRRLVVALGSKWQAARSESRSEYNCNVDEYFQLNLIIIVITRLGD